MKHFQIFFFSVLLLWMAGGCERGLSPTLGFGGVQPDFMLVTIACLSIFSNRRTGSLVGFFGGLIQGALAGANLGAYIVSRTVAGFFVGWFTALEFESNMAVAFFAALAATIGGRLLLLFLAPPHELVPFLLATIGSAVYNGVLAMPLYSLLRRVLDPPTR